MMVIKIPRERTGAHEGGVYREECSFFRVAGNVRLADLANTSSGSSKTDIALGYPIGIRGFSYTKRTLVRRT